MVPIRDNRRFTHLTCRSALAAALLSLAVIPAAADEFYLATGKAVKGAIVSQTATEYVIQTEFGTMKLNKADVTRVVDQGTSPVEIEGDIALKNGDLANARARYTQALNQATAGSLAAQRIQDKLERLTSVTQQAAVSQVVDQYNRALTLIQSRQYDAAEKLLDELAPRINSSDPLSSEVLKLKAQIHYGKGIAALDAVRLETAQQEFQAAIQADPTYYPAYLSIGESLLNNSATVADGAKFIERGLEAGGNQLSEQQRYSYQYMLAQKYFDQKNYARAAATFAALIPARDRYPTYADALDRAVESYVRMGEENMTSDFRETISNLNTALKLNPSNHKALFLLGRIYLDLGQIENAIVSLSRLVQLNPRYDEANYYLGRAYFQANDYENALRYLGIEISNNSSNYLALLDRAEVYIERGDYSAALSDLNAAKVIDREHWRSYFLTALLEYNRGDYKEAQSSLMEALDRRKSAIPAHLLMGKVLIAQDQLNGAREWLEQVSNRLQEVDTRSYAYQVHLAEALTQLGVVALEENSPRQAENYLQPAIQAVPDHAPALAAMADTKLMLANDAFVAGARDQMYQEAENLYLQAISNDPNSADYYSKLGRHYQLNLKDNQKAVEYYNLYADMGGTNSRVNAWITESGGTPRPELTAGTTSAATATTGTEATTETMISGTTGTIQMTTETITAPAGVVLPVDALMAETGIATITTSTATVAPPGEGEPPTPASHAAPGMEIPDFPAPPAQP